MKSRESESIAMLFAYIGPDVVLPVASGLAAILGVLMMIGRAPFRIAARTWRQLFRNTRP